ncbi:hypothetical protein HYH03_012795 [Edaphochlamys debaryana]|uniref:DNA-(apurinic or apyrimidinic site) lyase n=1 Tax=Edaphochlamys debaryana TaxID=47281 RepID=A0A836BU10_9CHLO|nr:hypothetical protein HYH03_012795 [Edaphochlamys debaryana]|eukprot:KAG2488622.1 hypothetical protein HYH03_012795 [Edaphochlamys debaryana]
MEPPSSSSPTACAAAAATGAGAALGATAGATAGAETGAGAGAAVEPGSGEWRSLGVAPGELQLDFSLPTGQSFRWRCTGEGQYTGVIGPRLVCVRQVGPDVHYRVLARGSGPEAAPGGDEAALRDYFNLDLVRLADLAPRWAAACARFAAVSPHFPGARMLRQDPLECLFQFICSSNNHISRIHGMVERLCSAYGTPLLAPEEPEPEPGVAAAAAAAAKAGDDGVQGPGAPPAPAPSLSYYAFPSLEQLAAATEEELRAAGFGYRARYVVGAAQQLLSKPGGGRQWLLGLRERSLGEAAAALEELPGIGPKVAACVCLFSLDKHGAIPVDTHVWQLATRLYRPDLRSKTLTKATGALAAAAFTERFGPYAGWAHNTLFISELAAQQHRLPPGLRQGRGGGGGGKRQRGAAGKGLVEEEAEGGEAGAREDSVGTPSASSGEGEGEGQAGSGSDAEYTPRPRGAAKRGKAGGAGAGKARGKAAAAGTGAVVSVAVDVSVRAGVAGVAVADGQAAPDPGAPVPRRTRARTGPAAGAGGVGGAGEGGQGDAEGVATKLQAAARRGRRRAAGGE